MVTFWVVKNNPIEEQDKMMKIGVNLIPDMPVAEVVETIRAAEDLGYEICLLDDEGFLQMYMWP